MFLGFKGKAPNKFREFRETWSIWIEEGRFRILSRVVKDFGETNEGNT